MSAPAREPESALGKALLAAAREESPSASSHERAMRGVDRALGRRAERARTRWLLGGALGLAAAAAAVVIVVRVKGSAATQLAPLATSEPTEQHASSAPSASALEMMQAEATATASGAASSALSATAHATAVAMATTLPPAPPSPPAGGKAGAGPSATVGPTAASPAARACGCAAADLLCAMRCSAKK